MYADPLANYCWFVRLVSAVCRRRYDDTSQKACSLALDDVSSSTSIAWDGLCLCFLLIQKRIFASRYFTFLVREIWAQTNLASRGAELIHEVQLKQVREQEAAEREVMEKIRTKMEHIRANQASSGRRHDDKKYHHQGKTRT